MTKRYQIYTKNDEVLIYYLYIIHVLTKYYLQYN